MTNNPALHDAVLAAIAASNEAWLTEDQDTNPAEAIAEEVDTNIPAVVGGATISQRVLLNSIAKGVMTGRNPVSTNPSTYSAIALVIASLFSDFGGLLLDTSTGEGGGGLAPSVTRVYYVMQGGNDSTGDGSFNEPFLTINAACSAIRTLNNSSTTLRYTIMVGAGRFTNQTVVLTPWTYVVGLSKEATRISFTSITLGAEWTAAGDHRSGFQNMSVSGGSTIDFNAIASNEGKIRFDDVVFNDQWHLIAFSAINQCIFTNCFMFAGYTQVGMNVIAQNTLSLGDVSLTSVNDGRNLPTLAGFINCGLATLQLNWTASAGSNAVTATFESTGQSGLLTLNGAQASIDPTSTPILFPAGVTTSGGAVDPRLVLTGSKAGNAALASVCTQLAATGGFVDSTS